MTDSYNQEYERVVAEILAQSDEVGDRGTRSKELLFQKFDFNLNDDPYLVQRKPSLRYALAEMIWYWAGSNDMKWIGTFSSFWNNISDDGKTSNSAYGYVLMNKFGFDQIEQVIKQLQIDKDSRRATIKINTPHSIVFGDTKNSIDTADEWCTMYLQFLVRWDRKTNQRVLNMTSNMRSNDMFFGLPYDILYFNSLGRYVARALNIGLGRHVHFVGSAHVYEKDYNKFDPSVKKSRYEFVNIIDLIDNAKKYYNDIQYLIYAQNDVPGAKAYVDGLKEKYVKLINEVE